MAKNDEIKVGDVVFAEQGYEDADGNLRDVTAVVESITEDGKFKLKSEDFDLSGVEFERDDFVKKDAPASGGSRGGNTGGAKGGKKVEVDEDVLKKLLKTVEDQGKKITDLEGAADVGRLARIHAARSEGKLVKKAKVNMYEGSIVLGWTVEKDDVFFSEDGRMHEDQQIKLFLFTKKGEAPRETKPMSYRQFSRLTTKQEAEVIKESRDADGRMSFTVLLPDGLELELPIVFLN